MLTAKRTAAVLAALFILLTALLCGWRHMAVGFASEQAADSGQSKVKLDDTNFPKVYSCENVIALTFDDGPRQGTTDKLLDGLRERNVKATFFLVGRNIEGNEELVKRIYDEGHLIGNHTYSHVKLTELSDAEAAQQIEKDNQLIESIIGCKPEYIRPPFGFITEDMAKASQMGCVLWSLDTNDWNTTNSAAVVRYVVNNAKNGDIILMHDIYDSSVAAALEIIDQLEEKGFVFVTADELMLQ